MLPSEIDGLPSSVSKHVWNIKLLKEALGLQNEKQVREWFYNHPSVLCEFEKANKEIEAHIRIVQNSAKAALEYLSAQEKMMAFQTLRHPAGMDLDYLEPAKKRKIKNF
jgi:hypothetical protein